MQRHFCTAVIAAAVLSLAAGCAAKPACDPKNATGCVIVGMRISPEDRGKSEVPDDDVMEKLATQDSSFFVSPATVAMLGQRGETFLRYEHFDRFVLERDLERIERYYMARGYYEAKVRAARILRASDSTVRVWIEVDEGSPTRLVRSSLVSSDPSMPLPEEPRSLKRALTRARDGLVVGERFEEQAFEDAKAKILRALTDRGYAYATVHGHATVDRAAHTASVTFTVDAGPICTFGPIAIVGLAGLPDAKLRPMLGFEPGDRYSTEVLEDAQIALGNSGVLASVRVEVIRKEENGRRRPVIPIRFVLQKGALRSIVAGGGAELGSRVRAHLVSSWEHRNFFGGLRRFFVDAKAGVLLYPLRLVNWDVPEPGIRPLPEIRSTVELRQPGFLEPRTTGLARAEVKFYRPDTVDGNDILDAPLFENLEFHGTLGLDRPFWGSRVRLGASLNAQLVAPFAMYQTTDSPTLPAGFDALYIPYVETNATLDLRRGDDRKPDPVHPRRGVFLNTNMQIAGIFPDGGWDLRIKPEARAYVPLPYGVTLAFRGAAGFLFPVGYGQQLFDSGLSCAPGDASCSTNPCATDDEECNAQRGRSLQISQLRGFYSGGLDTNRGYTRNGVNPQEEVQSLFSSTVGLTRSPIGGRFLWEAQIELRIPIYGDFGGSLFADASDAWYGPLAFRPHLSLGFGFRYDTPIGPLRADLGWRVPCAQVVGTCAEDLPENGGPPLLAGAPLNISIAVGNPF